MAMTRDDVIRLAVDAGLGRHLPAIADLPGRWWGAADLELLEHFAGLVAKAEREAWPDLTCVINWLEAGCDPKDAAKELRLYQAAIRARGIK